MHYLCTQVASHFKVLTANKCRVLSIAPLSILRSWGRFHLGTLKLYFPNRFLGAGPVITPL